MFRLVDRSNAYIKKAYEIERLKRPSQEAVKEKGIARGDLKKARVEVDRETKRAKLEISIKKRMSSSHSTVEEEVSKYLIKQSANTEVKALEQMAFATAG